MSIVSKPVRASQDEHKELDAIREMVGRCLADRCDDTVALECQPLMIDPESGEQIAIPRSLFDVLAQAVEVLTDGGAVAVMPYHAKLTTQDAADYLGVSRPYLISLLDEGVIPYQRLRSHRRILLNDVEAYRQKRDAERRAALDEMARESYARGLYDLPDEADDLICGGDVG